jgi:predicted O-methyltransferase YrrM
MTEKTWTDVEGYFDAALLPADPILEAALDASAAAGLPPIQIPPSQGKLLHLLSIAQRATRILEIGTLGGYSTLWLARSLGTDGRLITLEVNPHHAKVALENFARAGLERQIELRLGPALDSLKQLQTENPPPFDFVFIDADKVNNLAYVQAALDMTRVGSLIVVDNVVRDGAVVAEPRNAASQAVRRMTEWIGNDPRLSATVIQTVGTKGYDGFLLARVEA